MLFTKIFCEILFITLKKSMKISLPRYARPHTMQEIEAL